MSRSTIGMFLGGALLLIATACSSQPTSDPAPAVVENQAAESSDVGSAVDQSPEGKPAVTVSRSPT
jgi:hypothetical protein